MPENTKILRNRDVIILSQDVQSKFPKLSYFSLSFLKSFRLDIFNLNYNQFFKEVTTNINKILTSVINNFTQRKVFILYYDDLPPI